MTTTPEKPAGLSTWESELFDYLSRHIAIESDLLESYRQLAERSASPFVAYLIRLLAEDEDRHHELFSQLLNALRAPVEGDVGPAVPLVTAIENPRELAEEAERFVEFERESLEDLARIADLVKPMRGLSLWPLLVDMMRRDTEKHIAMLRFVLEQARDQR